MWSPLPKLNPRKLRLKLHEVLDRNHYSTGSCSAAPGQASQSNQTFLAAKAALHLAHLPSIHNPGLNCVLGHLNRKVVTKLSPASAFPDVDPVALYQNGRKHIGMKICFNWAQVCPLMYACYTAAVGSRLVVSLTDDLRGGRLRKEVIPLCNARSRSSSCEGCNHVV